MTLLLIRNYQRGTDLIIREEPFVFFFRRITDDIIEVIYFSPVALKTYEKMRNPIWYAF